MLARGIRQSSFMSCPDSAFKLAVWLLAGTRYKDYEWYDKYQRKRIVIHPGEVTFTIKQAMEDTKMSRMRVRVALKHVLYHGIFTDITPATVKLTNGYKHYKATKYQFYQDMDNYVGIEQVPSNHRVTNEQPSSNQRITNEQPLLKEVKEVKDVKEKDLAARRPAAPIPVTVKEPETLAPIEPGEDGFRQMLGAYAGAYNSVATHVVKYRLKPHDYPICRRFMKEFPNVTPDKLAEGAKWAFSKGGALHTMAISLASLCRRWGDIVNASVRESEEGKK